MNLFNKKIDKPLNVQSSLHNGVEIFEAIKTKLNESIQSIKIAAAWFTDNELFQILLNKSDNRNIKIEIVLDDNKENYWLPFIELAKKGALVKLSKGLGSNGRMHEKFCIIDNSILISGSYNWSKNARTENHESVIVSSISNTVADFNKKFEELLNSSSPYQSENLTDPLVTKQEALQQISKQESFTREFEKVLDEMIYSSIVAYDRESLVNKGYDRSQKCSGDANIITSELNTVYTDMLNSISTSEQKKESLKAKIDTHLIENKTKLTEKLEREKEELQLNKDVTIKGLNNQILFIKEANNKLSDEINKIRNADVISNNDRIKILNEEKNGIAEDSLKMPFRWYVDIPTYIGLIGVFIYVLLFYSSAAYILMFSQGDAKQAKLLGLPAEEMGIFYSKAIPKAYANGWPELLAILFVPFFLVCGIIFLKKVKTNFPKWIIKVICLLLVDGFTAIAVTGAIHETNYINGIEQEHFKLSGVFSEINLYLVFIFGMFSLLVFDLIASYILNNLESRNDFHFNKKKKLRIAQIIEEISKLNKENLELNANASSKKTLIDHKLLEIATLQNEIELQPSYVVRKINLAQNEINSQITNLENIVKIAYNKIDNELFSFSTHFMNDRINIFLQGWNNYIYSYYAKAISEDKIMQAKTNSEGWLRDHFTTHVKAKNYQYENN